MQTAKVTEPKWVRCPTCLKKFSRETASKIYVNGEKYAQCPHCGTVDYDRIIDDDEGVVVENIPEDPLPEGGENPVSFEV